MKLLVSIFLTVGCTTTGKQIRDLEDRCNRLTPTILYCDGVYYVEEER